MGRDRSLALVHISRLYQHTHGTLREQRVAASGEQVEAGWMYEGHPSWKWLNVGGPSAEQPSVSTSATEHS